MSYHVMNHPTQGYEILVETNEEERITSVVDSYDDSSEVELTSEETQQLQSEIDSDTEDGS